MKKLFLYLPLASLSVPFHLNAQYVIAKGDNELGISGMMTTYYNYNSPKPGISDLSKNSFYLRDAQLLLEGYAKKNYEVKLQIDFADLLTGINDPENPGLMDAYVLYKGLKFLDIKLGYQKLPYSRASQVSFAHSLFFHRSEIAKGDVFSQRDIGITLKRSFLENKIKLFAGVYTGMGENSLYLSNDMGGRPEYLARIEFAYPNEIKYRDIDIDHVETPMFTIGINGRYARKSSYSGTEYMIKTIDGKKSTYGFDVYGMYRGFSAAFEIHQMMMRPNTSLLLMGYKTGYFKAGGWLSQFNYHISPLRSAISIRYDESNMNDLIPSASKALSFAYVYLLKNYDSMIKLNLTDPLKQEPLPGVDPKKWRWQLILGWQIIFN